MKKPERILVTGGTGYIGSHTAVELLAAGYDVVIVDNLCNSKASVIDRISTIAARRPDFVQADVRDASALRALFAQDRFDAVVHFAGLKAVGESVAKPLSYYDNNVAGILTLTAAMAEAEKAADFLPLAPPLRRSTRRSTGTSCRVCASSVSPTTWVRKQ